MDSCASRVRFRPGAKRPFCAAVEAVRRPGDSLKLEQQHAEWARHEAMMLSINDPLTPEGSVADRALKRLEELVTEMDLEPGMMRMAHQVSAYAPFF